MATELQLTHIQIKENIMESSKIIVKTVMDSRCTQIRIYMMANGRMTRDTGKECLCPGRQMEELKEDSIKEI
jgi:hypothetical protein